MTDTTAAGESNFYDRVPYPSLSFGYTHPDHLATIATLLGMTPAPVERCRVLELGCASGGNIIPMAYVLPGATFLGVDYSQRQVAAGQELIDEVGLRNISLRCANILDITPEWGEFDYIIAHGVYSWVPPEVRSKLLDVCNQNLAANGVAYVSYNTLPGWHMLRIVRDLMLYATRGIDDPLERATAARAAVGFFTKASQNTNSAYAAFLKTYDGIIDDKLERVDNGSYASVLHDELEDINEPVYFEAFAAQAQAHGLQYMADTDFAISAGSRLEPDVRATLVQMSAGQVQLEQYTDFVACRSFRKSLLCHQGIRLDETVAPERVKRLLIASPAGPVSEKPDLYSVSTEKFEGVDKSAISTNHPVSKIALTYLGSIFPRMVSFDVLLAEARARLVAHRAQGNGASSDGPVEPEEIDAEALVHNLLTSFGYSRYLLELHTFPPPLLTQLNAKPVASPLARAQASRGESVTTFRHERARLDELDRFVLQHLDGEHDLDALIAEVMNGPVADGRLSAESEGQPITDPEVIRSFVRQNIEGRLRWLAKLCLLIA